MSSFTAFEYFVPRSLPTKVFDDKDKRQQERVDFVNQKILKVEKNEKKKSARTPLFQLSLSPNVLAKYQDCLRQNKTEEERVKLAKEMLNWKAPAPTKCPEIFKKYEKNSESSKMLRDHGNSLFGQRKFRDALDYFNMALMFGVDESLGLAYANRAAVLMELDDPAGALEDIDLALKHSYPASQIHNVEQRKLKCIEMMKKAASEDQAIKHLIDEERIQLIKVRDSVSHIEKRNPRAPAAVEIKFDETYGRQLVATRDVPSGTLLVLEDPYICVLDGQLSWDTEHCHHCFKRILRGIPCEKCIFAFYCSEACLRDFVESAHRFECSLLPHLHRSRLGNHVLEALRVICKVGSAELFRLFSSRDSDFFNRNQPFGTAAEDKYESDSYLSVYHLQSHPECLGVGDQCTYIPDALLMTEILDAETEFFLSIPRDQKNEFKDFVAAMMVRHMERRMVNQVGLNEYDELEDLTVRNLIRQRMNEPEKLTARLMSGQFTLNKFASGIYPLFGLLNHSCAPNAFYLNLGTTGRLAVFANQKIKKGEQILIAYVPTFFTDSKKDRQKELRRFNFDCTCIACRDNWPTVVEGRIQPRPRLCCVACSKEFSSQEKDSEDFRKCELKAPSWTCGRCGQGYKVEELKKRLKVNWNLCMEAGDQMYRGYPREALRISLRLLDYFQSNLIPPEGQLGALLDFWHRSLSLILHLAQ